MNTLPQTKACAWLGQAQLQETSTDTSWLVHVAIWADDAKQAKAILMLSTQGLDESISKVFKITPADDRHHPEQQALARRVSPFIPIALGKREALTDQLLEAYDDTEYLTITEHDIPPLPEQYGVPFWDKEWIVPELKELLFGQLETGDVIRTYLIMDASARRAVTKFDDLSTIEIPMQCLFKGDAAEELREVAPYLLDMTLPEGAWDDKDKVSSFHKDFFEKHWHCNTGIFIRSTAPMQSIYQHFRKFPRLQVEEDKRWVYFRFWDPRIAPSYFKSIQSISTKVAQWCHSRGSLNIQRIIGNSLDSRHAWVIVPHLDKLEGLSRIGSPMLSEVEIKGFEQYQIKKFDRKVAREFYTAYPRMNYNENQLREMSKNVRAWAYEYGIIGERDIKRLINISLFLGQSFHKDPRYEKQIDKILNAKELSSTHKIDRVVKISTSWIQSIYSSEAINGIR